MGREDASGRPRRPADFPPRWVASLLKTLFACVHYALVALLAYGAYTVGMRASQMLAAGQLLPALQAALQRPVPLPAAVSTAQAAATVGAVALAGALLGWLLVWRRRSPTYLLDFECYRPEDKHKVTYSRFITGSRDSGFFDEEAMDFQERILLKSGLSEETFFPPGLHLDPPEFDMNWARSEAELVMFKAVDDLLRKTGLHPRQIDVLVTNCSLFCPTPSLAGMRKR